MHMGHRSKRSDYRRSDTEEDKDSPYTMIWHLTVQVDRTEYYESGSAS